MGRIGQAGPVGARAMSSAVAGVAGVLLLSASQTRCTGTTEEPPPPPGDPVAVIAELGELAFIDVGGAVRLDGTGSHLGENTDDLGLTLTFFWEVDSAPFGSTLVDESLVPVVPDGATEPSPALVDVTPDLPGVYGISLQVSDGTRLSDRAFVFLSVGTENQCPTASVVSSQSAQTGVPTTLDGTASADPDVDDQGLPEAIDFQWAFSLVPVDSALTNEDIYYAGTGEPMFIPDVPGAYILQLRVTDGICTSEPVYVTVLASNGNAAPIADAGASILLTPCASSEIQLDGTASYDPEGASIVYEWSFTSVPNGSALTDALIQGRFTATPSFNFDVPGVYTQEQRVDDGELVSEPDNVAVRAVPSLPNATPSADGGANITINASAQCTSGPYGGCSGCTPCGSRDVVLSAEASYDPDGDPLNYQWNLQSGSATLSGTNSVEVEVELPAISVTCNQTLSRTVNVDLTVYDCRGADSDTVTITFVCDG